MKEKGFRNLRRVAAFGLVLALLAVPGVSTFAGQDVPDKKTDVPAVDATASLVYDSVNWFADDAGNKVGEFVKDGVVVRREIYAMDRRDVYVLDGQGTLVLDPAQSKVYPTQPPPPWNDIKKYQDKDDRTVCDFLKDGVVIRREIYTNYGSLEVWLPDATGALALDPLQSKILPEPVVDPNAQPAAYDDARKFQNADNETVCEYLKAGVVVRQEIYRRDRIDVYVANEAGELVYSEKESQVLPTPEPPWFDDARKYQAENGDLVCDYLMKGAIVKREVYPKEGGMETYLPDDAGNLVLQPAK